MLLVPVKYINILLTLRYISVSVIPKKVFLLLPRANLKEMNIYLS